jgi:hypothetical protein
MKRVARAIASGVAVAGTLDLLSAFGFSAVKGIGPVEVLHFVASGPFGDAMKEGGLATALLGVLVHYALMTAMVTIFTLAAIRIPAILKHPLVGGMLYGLAIYLVMYWIVVPARFGSYPKPTLWAFGNALFSHLFCVGLAMGWAVSKALRRS